MAERRGDEGGQVSLAQDLVVNGFVDLEQPCCFGFHMPADEIAHTDHPSSLNCFASIVD
jgi:hypothetical protein